jgi:hypothetical protein
VRRPELLAPVDFAIHDVVDGFLHEHGRPPLSTIAGTIFPANLYLHGGAEELYTYPQIYPRIPSQWGTYAIRLLRKPTYRKGNGQAEINPLRIIVEKIKKQLAGGRMRAVYEANLVEDTDHLELPIYDAECDARGTRCQPCLSHLSFKCCLPSLGGPQFLPGLATARSSFAAVHSIAQPAMKCRSGISQIALHEVQCLPTPYRWITSAW